MEGHKIKSEVSFCIDMASFPPQKMICTFFLMLSSGYDVSVGADTILC